MPFIPESAFTKIPAAIGALRIILGQDQNSTELNTANVDFTVKDSNDEVFKKFQGLNLLPELTPAQKTTLTGIVNGIRTKIVNEVLP